MIHFQIHRISLTKFFMIISLTIFFMIINRLQILHVTINYWNADIQINSLWHDNHAINFIILECIFLDSIYVVLLKYKVNFAFFNDQYR